MNKSKFLVFMVLAIFVSGCSMQPKFYPNDVYKNTSKEQRDKDITECENLANEEAVSGSQVALEAAGSLAGLATALRGGSFASVYAWNNVAPSTSDIKKKFVEICLQKKGYEITGWGI